MIPLERFGEAAAEAYGMPLEDVVRRLRDAEGRTLTPRATRATARQHAMIAANAAGHSMNACCAYFATARSGGNSRWYAHLRSTCRPEVVAWITARAGGGNPPRPASLPAIRIQPVDVVEAAIELGAHWTTFAPPGHPMHGVSAVPGRVAWRRAATEAMRRATEASLPEIAYFTGRKSHGSLVRKRRDERPHDTRRIDALIAKARTIAAARTPQTIHGGIR